MVIRKMAIMQSGGINSISHEYSEHAEVWVKC